MNDLELAFFSGDTYLIRNNILAWLEVKDGNSNFFHQTSHEIIEAVLAIEAFDLIEGISRKLKANKITPQAYDHFRLLQLNGDISCFKYLASFFDNYYAVINLLEKANENRETIIAYELGGLGDYIEGITILQQLISQHFSNLNVIVRIPTDLSNLLNSLYQGSNLHFENCTWDTRKIDGAIHLLTLTAIARNEFQISPQPIGTKVNEPYKSKLINQLFQSAEKHSKGKFIIWNSQSQPKLRPVGLRRSYYHRSLNHNTWQSISKDLATSFFVIDVSEFPRYWSFKEVKNIKGYVHIPAKEFTFFELAFLCTKASRIITIDSMLGHLAAALSQKFELLLAVGHEQRWFIDYTKNDNMYKKLGSIRKQRKLHKWEDMKKVPHFDPLLMEI